MNEQPADTYTTQQAMQALNLTARSAFHHLRKQYPKAFVIVQTGKNRHYPTLYDKTAIDNFIIWRSKNWK